MQNSKYKIQNVLMSFCLLSLCFGVSSCSLPNLEKPQCREARDTVKQFYSWYIGTDADERARHPEINRKFVSSTFASSVLGDPATDPFLLTNEWPKTFRVGTCTSVSDDKATLQVVLLWRDETKSDQKEVKVDAIKYGEKWQINKVSN